MKTFVKMIAAASLCFACALAAHAGSKAKSYQVTGPVVELTDTKIVVDKEGEKWEIARTQDSKVAGELKVGSKVTVQYAMTATDIEVKPAKESKETKETKETKESKERKEPKDSKESKSTKSGKK